MARAKLLTGIDIVDQESLTRANMVLEGQKMLEVKCRVSTNASAKGINAAMLIPPFSYATVQSAVEMIKKDDWLGKGDVEKYFLNFPFAVESRWMFGVCVLTLVYFFAKVFFGLGSAPYYTSVWGAEFRLWALHRNINCVHMVDDWLVAETSEVQARKSMSSIVSMLVDIGLAMADHKFDFGQQLTFLGVKIDTVRMRMSFDSLQCQVMVVLLTGHLDSLERFQRIPYTEAVHVCGKLNWLAEVLQAGRVHTSSWWKYLPFAEKNLPVDLRSLIIHDTKWWIGVISKWADNDLSGWEFPIMSASELLDDPNRMQVVGSDAAGDDGIGFYHGSRNCDDPQFYSFQWPEGFVMISSMWGELKALEAYLLVVNPEDKVVVWVTDSLSAAYAINCGRAKSDAELALVDSILTTCDMSAVLVIALWVPREHNQLADYLSHLAAYLDRHSVEGRVSQLEGTAGSGNRVFTSQPQENSENDQQLDELCDVVHEGRAAATARHLRQDRRLCHRLCPEAVRKDEFCGKQVEPGQESYRADGARLVEDEREIRAEAADCKPGLRRLRAVQQKEAADQEPDQIDDQHPGFDFTAGPVHRAPLRPRA